MSTVRAPRQSVRPARPGEAPIRNPVSRRPVRVVQAPATPPARAPFVVLVLVLLSLGLGALLLLNTLLAQGSFTLHALDAKVAGLADQEQALQQKAATLASPKRLARSASELGMVASVNPAFLRAEDGKVLGAPVPAPTPLPVIGSDTEADTTAGTGSGTDMGTDAGTETTTETTTATTTDTGTDSGAGEVIRNQTSQESKPQDQQGGANDKGNGGADR